MVSSPSLTSIGIPTTRASGAKLSTIARMAFQSGFPARLRTVATGLAVPLTVCPTATPMRLVP